MKGAAGMPQGVARSRRLARADAKARVAAGISCPADHTCPTAPTLPHLSKTLTKSSMSEIAESVSATSGGLPPTPAKRLLDQAIESQATTTDVAPVDGPPIPPLQADDQDDGPSFAKRMRLLSPTTTEERETSGLTSSNDLDCDGVGCSAGPSGIDLKGKGREETINQAAADKSVDLPKALKPDERLERLVDELESELSCPVCAAVLYKVRAALPPLASLLLRPGRRQEQSRSIAPP